MFKEPDNLLKKGDFIGNPLIFPPDKEGEQVSYVISESGTNSLAIVEGQRIGKDFSLYRREIIFHVNLIFGGLSYLQPVPTTIDELTTYEYIRGGVFLKII